MNEILSQPPKSVFKFYNEVLTYEDIQRAIATNSANRFLQGIVSLCKANPDTVCVVVYRAFSDSVLMVFGAQPTAVILEGSEVKKNLQSSSEKDYFYIFTHTK